MAPKRAKSQSVSGGDAPNAKTSMSPPASPKVGVTTSKTSSSHSRSTSIGNSHRQGTSTGTRSTSISASPTSTTPSLLRFPLVVILNLSLSALLFSLTSSFTAGDLASISKHVESWIEVSGVVGWKILELGIYWFAGLDAYDTMALSFLLMLPTQVFILLFYAIRPTTVLVSLGVNVLASTFPFILLRRLLPVHSSDPSAQKFIPRLNRSIISDPATTISTSLLAAAIFAVVLEASFATWLPSFLITHFSPLRTLEPAYAGAANLLLLLVYLFPAGLAAREFLFVSSTASGAPKTKGTSSSQFNPATATLGQTLYHNAWGWYNIREKSLIGRTATAAAMVAVETTIQLWGTVQGSTLEGALGYAAMWSGALVIVGAVFGWVGGPTS